MIYFISQSTQIPNSYSELLKNNFSIFIFNDSQSLNHIESSPYELINHADQMSLVVQANLKEQKHVLILPRPQENLNLPKDLTKNRILIQPDYIYLHPRASYFFKNNSVKIDFSNYEKTLLLAKSWGK